MLEKMRAFDVWMWELLKFVFGTQPKVEYVGKRRTDGLSTMQQIMKAQASYAS